MSDDRLAKFFMSPGVANSFLIYKDQAKKSTVM